MFHLLSVFLEMFVSSLPLITNQLANKLDLKLLECHALLMLVDQAITAKYLQQTRLVKLLTQLLLLVLTLPIAPIVLLAFAHMSLEPLTAKDQDTTILALKKLSDSSNALLITNALELLWLPTLAPNKNANLTTRKPNLAHALSKTQCMVSATTTLTAVVSLSGLSLSSSSSPSSLFWLSSSLYSS